MVMDGGGGVGGYGSLWLGWGGGDVLRGSDGGVEG